MTAAEARIISKASEEKRQSMAVQRALSAIKEAASKGDFACTFLVREGDAKMTQDGLKALGYTVSKYSVWTGLKISW
jgi:hypothetical protein